MLETKRKEIGEIDWDTMTIADGYLFGELLKNKKLCDLMIKRLLGLENVSKIKYLQTEVTQKPGYLSKGVRLDICTEDEAGDFYNVEMQKKDTKELPQRARYYHSVMDTTHFKSGNDYIGIRDNYVIFICQEDIFGLGHYRYEVKSSVANHLNYEDGTHTVFFNTKGYRGEISSEAKAILDFVHGIVNDDPFIQELTTEVEKIKNNEKWRDMYMTQYIYEQDAKREARKEGRKEGRAEGRAEGKVEGKIEGKIEGKAEERLEIARKALDSGASLAFISKITELELSVISSLRIG